MEERKGTCVLRQAQHERSAHASTGSARTVGGGSTGSARNGWRSGELSAPCLPGHGYGQHCKTGEEHRDAAKGSNGEALAKEKDAEERGGERFCEGKGDCGSYGNALEAANEEPVGKR